MALLVLRGPDGRGVLVHSGDIGPSWRPPWANGYWPDVWARFERELAADGLAGYSAGMNRTPAPRQPT